MTCQPSFSHEGPTVFFNTINEFLQTFLFDYLENVRMLWWKKLFFQQDGLHHTLLFICINMTYFSWKMDWVKRSCIVPTPITRSIPPWLLPLGHLKSVVYKNRPCNFDLKDAITTERQKVNSEIINKVKNS